jgi:hypothetical protein
MQATTYAMNFSWFTHAKALHQRLIQARQLPDNQQRKLCEVKFCWLTGESCIMAAEKFGSG